MKPHRENKHTLTFFLDFVIDVVDVDCVVWSDIHDVSAGTTERQFNVYNAHSV